MRVGVGTKDGRMFGRGRKIVLDGGRQGAVGSRTRIRGGDDIRGGGVQVRWTKKIHPG